LLQSITNLFKTWKTQSSKERWRVFSGGLNKVLHWFKTLILSVITAYEYITKKGSVVSSRIKARKFSADNPVSGYSLNEMPSGNKYIFAIKSWFAPYIKFRMSPKIFIGIFLIFSILFVGSIRYFSNKEKLRSDEIAFEAQLKDVKERRSKAAAALIYNDEARALMLLNGAEATLNSLNLNTDDRIRKAESERAALNIEMNKVMHIITPDVKQFNFEGDFLGADDSRVILSNGRVFSYDSDGLVDSGSSDSLGKASIVANYNENVVFIANDKFMEYSQDGGSFIVGINTVEGETASAIDMTHYGERLYVLTSGQVYKHQRLAGGDYGPGIAWVSDDTSFGNANGMAIDGSVWIAENDKIRHFDRGNEIGVNFSEISPRLLAITDIWTADTTDLLYILDASESRVVVFKKSGEFVGQYVSDQFGRGVDIEVDVNSNVVFVMGTDAMLSFSLSGE